MSDKKEEPPVPTAPPPSGVGVVAAATVKKAAEVVTEAVVEKVNNAARTVEPEPEFVATSSAGRFAIMGSGFSSSGTVLLNGMVLPTTSWSANHIKGTLPYTHDPANW